MTRLPASLLEKLQEQGAIPPAKKRNKYNAEKTVVDGFIFDSKAEAIRYEFNKLRIQAGELLYQLRQVPFHLPGNTKYVVDFVEAKSDGTIEYVDVKGKVTAQFKKNKKQVEALYPVEIVCIRLTNYSRMTFERFEV